MSALVEAARAALEAMKDALSACRSVSMARDRKIERDGSVLYAQTGDWCRWLQDDVGPAIDKAGDDLIAALAAEQPAEPVAWRLRDTGYTKRPVYCYLDDKESALAHAAHVAQSRDDGHLTELTPLYLAAPPAQPASPAAPAQMPQHWSDCATHNAPAYPPGPCDCMPTPAMCRAAVEYVNGADVYSKLPREVLDIEESIYSEVWKAMQAAAPAQVPQPLSDEQIEALVLATVYEGDSSTPHRDSWAREIGIPFARALETAHGIKGTT